MCTRLRLTSDFEQLIARTGLSKLEFARRSGVGYATIKGLENPRHQPNRRGGMRPVTAWRLAQAYAAVAGLDTDAAYKWLIVTEPRASA